MSEQETPRRAKASDTKASAVNAVIEAWYVERINNSVVSRNTEILNYLRAELDELKRRLAQS